MCRIRLYWFGVYCIISYCIAPQYTVPYCIVLCCIVSYCIALQCIVLYSLILYRFGRLGRLAQLRTLCFDRGRKSGLIQLLSVLATRLWVSVESASSAIGLCRRCLGTGIVLYCILLYCIVLYCIALHTEKEKQKKTRNARPFLVLCLRFPPPKTVEKQGGMLAFFCISSASKLVVFSSILVSFSLPRAPLEPPEPPFFPDGAPGRFFSDF